MLGARERRGLPQRVGEDAHDVAHLHPGLVEVPEGSVAAGERRVTYRQVWPAYNRAQCTEKETVRVLLRTLCDGIAQPPAPRMGRPRLSLADVIYGATMKVYVTTSGRRATTDLVDCQRHGLLARTPAYNSLFRYVERPELTPLLVALVEESATPLREFEHHFSPDSTGLSTSTYARWFDEKYGKDKRARRWVKLHAVVGTATHVMTAVRVTEYFDNDCPEFAALLASTKAKGFDVREVSADKAYLSNENFAAIEALGARAFIAMKSNSSPTGNSAAWERLYHYIACNKADFLAHYHQRSNVETAFSSLKRKFGASVRSKLRAAQFNEVLLKALAHNLSQLVHAIHELKVDPKFWMPAAAPKTLGVAS